MDMRESGEMTAEEESMRQKELMKLQKDLQSSQTKAQEDLQKKRDELLAPLVEKMQTAIDAVREEQGYDYVLSASAGGSSLILSGPEEHNLTQAVMKQLGIEVPAGLESGGGLEAGDVGAPSGAGGSN